MILFGADKVDVASSRKVERDIDQTDSSRYDNTDNSWSDNTDTDNSWSDNSIDGVMSSDSECPVVDPWPCGTQWLPSYCEQYYNVPDTCLIMCGKCPGITNTFPSYLFYIIENVNVLRPLRYQVRDRPIFPTDFKILTTLGFGWVGGLGHRRC